MPDRETNTEKSKDQAMELKESKKPMKRGLYMVTSSDALDITVSGVTLLLASSLHRLIYYIFCLNKFG